METTFICVESMEYLKNLGFEISYVNILDNGLIDIDDLKRHIRNDTILISIGYVNSEMGIMQPIKEIGALIKKHPRIYFHVDGTQAIGKINIDLTNIDLFSFSAHKIYGLKGIGCLYKRENIELENLIHGGKSQSIYRGGTPPVALIVSFAKALRLSLENIETNYEHVLKLNKLLKNSLSNYKYITINSNDNCIPHILNISIIGVKSETFLHALEKHDIYVSTQTACSESFDPSKTIMAVYHDKARAISTIRISISYKTTKEEIDLFLKYFDVEYNDLKFMMGE